jgi:hypothetical protein
MAQRPMPQGCSPLELLDDSLTLHDQCTGAGLIEASYHALATAMLCAEAASSRKAIDLVIELAHERQQAIDAERPSHPWSTREAHDRGASPLFESLATAADAIRGSLKRTG